MSSSLVIVGAGGHAVSVANVALGSGMSIIAFVDDAQAGGHLIDIPIITTQQCMDAYPTENFAIAIGDNATREHVSHGYKASLPYAKFPAIIHHSAVVGAKSEIGEGTIVMPLAHVGPSSKVEPFCILNTASTIDHDCNMKAFSSIAPRVVTGGNVKIGLRSAVSIGAAIKHGVVVGDDTVIGANSYVNKSVDSLVVAYGSPCKFVRKRTKGDPYLS